MKSGISLYGFNKILQLFFVIYNINQDILLHLTSIVSLDHILIETLLLRIISILVHSVVIVLLPVHENS